MRTDTSRDWNRLGRMLIRRRVELDPRYRNRSLFTRERGLQDRIVSDIENHRRENFSPATITTLEVAYELEPGSIEDALAGGDLTPEADPQPEEAQPSGLLPPRFDVAAILAQLRAVYHGTPGFADLLDNPGLSDAEKVAAVGVLTSLRAQQETSRDDGEPAAPQWRQAR